MTCFQSRLKNYPNIFLLEDLHQFFYFSTVQGLSLFSMRSCSPHCCSYLLLLFWVSSTLHTFLELSDNYSHFSVLYFCDVAAPTRIRTGTHILQQKSGFWTIISMGSKKKWSLSTDKTMDQIKNLNKITLHSLILILKKKGLEKATWN